MAARFSRLLVPSQYWKLCWRHLTVNSVISRHPRRLLYAQVNRWNGLVTTGVSPGVTTWSEPALVRACVDDGGPDGGGNGKRWKLEGALLSLAGVLVLCGGYRDPKEERLFIIASKNNDTSTMARLMANKGLELNCRHPLGWTALHAAVLNGNHAAVHLLVERGADVNVKDEFSSARRKAAQEQVSPMEVAQHRDKEFSSRINHYASYSGFTPLHYAVIADNRSIIQYLLDHGADPTVEDNSGRKPINYCTDENVRNLLKEYASKVEERKLREQLEERRKFPLEDRLRQHLVGQEGAITAVAAAVRRREMGWADSEHPLVMLFLGSSGIGKTELAKQVARYIHKDNAKGFIRLDMSEYQEKHEVAKLIGSPPGYIGHEQGGQLTSRLRQCPKAVVLFDEVDKAHPDVLTVLLQLFDEGLLTDGQGKTIECKGAMFVMTSNLASDEIAQHALQLRREAAKAATSKRLQVSDPESIEISREFKEEVVEPILKRHFHRDEFLGRINEMVYFLPFSRSELNQLVERELQIWQDQIKKRHYIKLSWEREVLDLLADGYSVKYGARSIHHEVERRVINQLAAAYEQQLISKGSEVRLVTQTREDARPVINLLVQGKPAEINRAGLLQSLNVL